MNNWIYEGDFFDNFQTKTKKAIALATDKQNVQFDFNGITCVVNRDTRHDLLFRDYLNAFRMEWKTVGPDCAAEYPEDVQDELDRRNKVANEKAVAAEKVAREKDRTERELFDEKTKGIEVEFSNPDYWDTGKAKNSDPYGGCVYEYAEGWAKLMQVEMQKGRTLIECAEQTSFQLGFLGITGYMYGAAVSVLSASWKYGEELRKWHNKEYKPRRYGSCKPGNFDHFNKVNFCKSSFS